MSHLEECKTSNVRLTVVRDGGRGLVGVGAEVKRFPSRSWLAGLASLRKSSLNFRCGLSPNVARFLARRSGRYGFFGRLWWGYGGTWGSFGESVSAVAEQGASALAGHAGVCHLPFIACRRDVRVLPACRCCRHHRAHALARPTTSSQEKATGK